MQNIIVYAEGEVKPLIFPGVLQDYYLITINGKIFNKFGDGVKTFIGNTGYERIPLRKLNGGVRKHSVHRLVAFHFVPNSNMKIKNQVNHIDGSKTKNHASNLEWVSQSENVIHAYDNGLCPIKGENSHLSKPDRYPDSLLHEIAKLLELKYSIYDIINQLKLVECPSIRSSAEYQRWRHYIKDFRNKNCRREIWQQYNF